MKVSRLDRPVLLLSALAEVQCTMQGMWAVMESKANVSGAVHSPVTQILQMRNVVKKKKKCKKRKKWCIKVAVHTRSAGWWVNYAEEKTSLICTTCRNCDEWSDGVVFQILKFGMKSLDLWADYDLLCYP